jgi:hypothetical protein
MKKLLMIGMISVMSSVASAEVVVHESCVLDKIDFKQARETGSRVRFSGGLEGEYVFTCTNKTSDEKTSLVLPRLEGEFHKIIEDRLHGIGQGTFSNTTSNAHLVVDDTDKVVGVRNMGGMVNSYEEVSYDPEQRTITNSQGEVVLTLTDAQAQKEIPWSRNRVSFSYSGSVFSTPTYSVIDFCFPKSCGTRVEVVLPSPVGLNL